MNVYGTLIRAQLEPVSGAPTAGVTGRIVWDTADTRAKVDNGSSVISLLANDQKLVIGTNGTAANNVRINRSAAATLEFLTGDDTTVEGSANTAAWATIQAKIGGCNANTPLLFDEVASPSAPASGKVKLYAKSDGRMYSMDDAGTETLITPSTTVQTYEVVSKTATYTATTADWMIRCDASGGAFSINLPAAASNDGREYVIVKTDSSFNAVTIDGNASETIGGSTTTTLNSQNEMLTIICDGSNWQIVDRKTISGWTTYSPTISNLGAGSGTFNEARWRRVGTDIEIRIHFTKDTTPGSGGTGVTVSLPSGLAADATVATSAAVGSGYTAGIEAVGQRHPLIVTTSASGSVVNFIDNGTLSNYSGADFGNSVILSFVARIPIANWNA